MPRTSRNMPRASRNMPLTLQECQDRLVTLRINSRDLLLRHRIQNRDLRRDNQDLRRDNDLLTIQYNNILQENDRLYNQLAEQYGPNNPSDDDYLTPDADGETIDIDDEDERNHTLVPIGR